MLSRPGCQPVPQPGCPSKPMLAAPAVVPKDGGSPSVVDWGEVIKAVGESGRPMGLVRGVLIIHEST
ncbi:hypothetical protein [Streptomyces sp. YIM S03343]